MVERNFKDPPQVDYFAQEEEERKDLVDPSEKDTAGMRVFKI